MLIEPVLRPMSPLAAASAQAETAWDGPKVNLLNLDILKAHVRPLRIEESEVELELLRAFERFTLPPAIQNGLRAIPHEPLYGYLTSHHDSGGV